MMSEGERKPSNAPAMPKEAQVMATILRDLGINGKIARYRAIKFWGLVKPLSTVLYQGCGSGSGTGSGSVLDPYSIGSVDPDPYSESGSGSRRATMTHKSRQ